MKVFPLAAAVLAHLPILVEGVCDPLPEGDKSGVMIPPMEELNTAEMQKDVPSVNPRYSPLQDSFCFNEAYKPGNSSLTEMVEMYKDFKDIFKWGFENSMGSPLQSVSEDNNDVTNNRFPGMYLRMCFHDNTVIPDELDFQQYIDEQMDLRGRWSGNGKYLETSGADASLLMCEEERLHPNNDYDKTASRVLYTMQVEGVIAGGKSLKDKYKLSYADLLHNGCVAAHIYLTRQPPTSVLKINPMQFGRHDACYVDECDDKHSLCGLPNALPGLGLTASETNNWFKSRGMDECLWISTMWSHTTMDNMAMTCPLKYLPCVPGTPEFDEFDDKCTDEPYFFLGDTLDYFSFFLKPGKHEPSDSCKWKKDNRIEPWPLTKIDCTLGLDNVQSENQVALATAITNFHKPNYNAQDIFLCALNILGGRGDVEHGVCDLINKEECQSKPGHKFGAVFDKTKALKGTEAAKAEDVNVLTGAPCYQSSIAFSLVQCERGNDGNTDPVWNQKSIFHTRNQANPSWTSIFFEATEVSKIILYNRDDGLRSRADNTVATLFDVNGNPVWTSPPVQPSFLVEEFSVPSVQANFIRVQKEGTEPTGPLHLAEVEVYGAELETALPLEDGDAVYLQNNGLNNRWLNGDRGTGGIGALVRDHFESAYEQRVDYQWSIRSQANDFLPGGAPCIRYGDIIGFQVAPRKRSPRWLRGTDKVATERYDPDDDSFKWIIRSTTDLEDSLFGQCVLDKSPVYIQERKSQNYLLGALDNDNEDVYARAYDDLLAEKYQWLIRFNPGRGEILRFDENGQSLS